MWIKRSLWTPHRRNYGSSVGNIFEGSFTEGVTGAVNAIFEGGFKFSASEARNMFDITDLEV